MNESLLVWGLGDTFADPSTPHLKPGPPDVIVHTVITNHTMAAWLSRGLSVNLYSTGKHTALHVSLEDTFSHSLCSSN